MKSTMLALLLAALASPAGAADYTLAAGSTLGFTGSFQGESFDGSFKTFEAAISHDPANPSASTFEVKIDLGSVVTGDRDRDSALPESVFFDVGKFPQATFISTSVRPSGDALVVDGSLTIKGVSKPVRLDLTFAAKGAGATVDTTTTVKRLDFGIGSGEYADTATIADEVKVKAHLELSAK